jgi:hypothetical protein
MKCEEFIRRFESQYPALKWTLIQEQINKMIKDTFEIVST